MLIINSMHQPKVLALILTLLLAIALSGCGRDDLPSNGRTATVDSAIHPDTETSGAVIHLFDRGQVTAEIHAAKIVQFSSKDSTMAYALDIDSYDSAGTVGTEVTGDSAIIRQDEGFFTVFGNVVVITPDQRRLETEYLHWNSQSDRIYTDAYVTITTPQETIRGWGLEADQRVRRYKILHQVSAEIEDASRLEQEEGPGGSGE